MNGESSNLTTATVTVSTAMEPPSKKAPERPRQTAPSPGSVRRTKPRRWLPYGGAAVLLALIAAGLWPKPAPVETVQAVTGPMRATVNEEGKTRIKHRFVVSAPVPGQLRRIPLKAGAEVTAGETIVAIIDPLTPTMLDARSRALAEARRDTAAANVERARAAEKFAASELKRFEALFAEKTVAVQELEQVQWREASAAKELTAAEAALRQAEAELAEFGSAAATNADTTSGSSTPLNGQRAAVEVKAPASGRVLRVIEESSRAVTAGMPLLEIGDPADLEVVVEVLSRDGAALKPGTRIELEQWGGDEPLQASVRLVEPAGFTKVSALGVEEQRVKIIADIITPIEKRANLGDQFRVEARIIIWQSKDVLKVASGAIFRRGDQHAVFVVRNSRAMYQPIKIGRRSDTETEVTEGLRAGDNAILYPGDRISEGQRVKPVTIRSSR